MIPRLTINLLRALFVIFACLMGLMIGEEQVIFSSQWVGAAAGLVFGLLIILFDMLLKGFSLRTFSSATFGLFVGFLSAHLLLASNLLKYQTEDLRWVSSLVVYSACAYLGMMLAVRSNRDEFSLIIPYVRFRQSGVQDAPLLLDTSVIIDGRISDICATGFLSSSLVVPRFVLDELQQLADSADSMKRERGRRGLDALNMMQQDPALSVTIHEALPEDDAGVDTRLIRLATLLQARIVTNDSGISKIARLLNVVALNLNELAKAVRPAINTGDEIDLTLVKEGRDSHQAVGYLPDGTMIVVNHARALVGRTVPITVAGTLQTAAGRLFFAELKHGA